uniref:G-protein coupled receptors family 1 profile domain-containing protein n=1 Tax=Plectus sambesii TaxID=2011161 RepID=A0A914XC15_9BILA
MDDVDGLATPNESILLPADDTVYQHDATGCFESTVFERFQFVADNVMFMMSLAATVFNVAVVLCAIKLFRKGGDTVHLFIISMTLGDLILTTFCIPNEFLMRKSDFFKQTELCSVRHFGNWLGLAASGLSLTMLNVDKLIFFQWPLSYDRAMSSMRAGLFCIAIWLLAFSYVSYVWYAGVVWIEHDCSLQLTKGIVIPFYELFIFFFCILPVTSSLFVSIYLY